MPEADIQFDKPLAITVNGETVVTRAGTLAELLVELGYDAAGVATALNDEFVPRGVRGSTRLSGDDRIEIVAPRQGG